MIYSLCSSNVNQCTHVIYPVFQKPVCALSFYNILELFMQGNHGCVPYVPTFLDDACESVSVGFQHSMQSL